MQRHRQLAAELASRTSAPRFEQLLAELRPGAGGNRAGGRGQRSHARARAGLRRAAGHRAGRADFCSAQGIDCSWWDAREGLRSGSRAHASDSANYLSATCDFSRRRRRCARVWQHWRRWCSRRGTSPATPPATPCCSGRGGSDTSGAYFAAKLRRRAPRDLDRRARHVQRQPALDAGRRACCVPCITMRRRRSPAAARGCCIRAASCRSSRRRFRLWIYATQTPQLEGTHISASGRRRRRPGQGGVPAQGHHAAGAGQPGHVASRSDFWPTPSRSSSATACRWIRSPPPRPTSPCRSIRRPICWIKARSSALVDELGQLCRVQVIGPCAQVGLVGRNIRGILHQLGAAFKLFAEQRVYMVGQAANDLNFTIVVDEAQGDRLAQELHDLLIRPVAGDTVLGPTWAELYGLAKPATAERPWWRGAPRRAAAPGGSSTSARSSTTARRCKRPRADCASLQSVESRFLRHEGESEPGAVADHCGRGARFRMRVARRDRAPAASRCRDWRAGACCTRRTSRRARSTPGPSSRA